jgi:hypothetical protein
MDAVMFGRPCVGDEGMTRGKNAWLRKYNREPDLQVWCVWRL